MPRPAAHRIKRHQVYTVQEAALALGRHPGALRRWITRDGLPADRSLRPWLLRGEDLKAWLALQEGARRTALGPAEIWCLPCRRAVRPAGDMAEYRSRTSTLGLLTGICPHCDRLVSRVVRAADLHLFAARLEVTRT